MTAHDPNPIAGRIPETGFASGGTVAAPNPVPPAKSSPSHASGAGKGLLSRADHWRLRAMEARAHAEQMNDANARLTMCGIAEEYEALARLAQARRDCGQ